MIRLFKILIFVLLVQGCHSSSNELEGLWVNTYMVNILEYEYESEFDRISKVPMLLVNFEEDSVVSKRLYFERGYEIEEEKKTKYLLKGDTIVFFDKGTSEDYMLSTYEDSLIIKQFKQRHYQLFQRLTRYKLGNKLSEFEKLITTTTFILDSIRYEFKDNGRLIYPDFNLLIGDVQMWKIDVIDDELFLIVDGNLGFSLHIKSFDSQSISGILYDEKNKELTFKKTPLVAKFNSNDLNGVWIEYEYPWVQSSRVIYETSSFYENEQLVISDNYILRYFKYKKDTMIWEANREQDLILLNMNSRDPLKKWQILELNDDRLIIDRERRTNSVRPIGVERKVYQRK